jgi:hypothetical protein
MRGKKQSPTRPGSDSQLRGASVTRRPKLTPQQRAGMAARVLAGEPYVPTLLQVAQLFRVSCGLVRDAVRNG